MTEALSTDRVVELSSAAEKVKLNGVRSSSSDSGVVFDCSENNGKTKKSVECEDSVKVSDVSEVSLYSSSSKDVQEDASSVCAADVVANAESLISWQRDVPVILRTSESGPLSETPVSVMTALRLTASKYPNHPALVAKDNGEWHKMSYHSYLENVCLAAKAFIKLGLEACHGVGILGFNSVEWFISDLAAIFAGGLATGIYATNTPDACQFVAENAECNLLIVENNVQLKKILEVWDRLPHLKAIIQYKGTPEEHPNVYSWQQMYDIGRDVADSVLDERINQQAPNKCCTLIYTSGTTGNPKGVMLSHDNLVWTARMAGTDAKLKPATEEIVSYLPLSHVAAQILDIFIPMLFAATVYFAQPDALKGSLGETLKEVHPTAFLGVPRVWEKIQEKMMAVGRSQSAVKRKIAMWAKGIGLKGQEILMNHRRVSRKSRKLFRGTSMPFGWSLANALVFRKVRQELGLDRCHMCMTAAAPIMKETLDFFASLNIPILEIYGMSESSGPHTLSVPWMYRIGSVGQEISGCTTKIDEKNTAEVCMNGRNVFMGYLNAEEKTRETVDEEGWLHSGDIGRRDDRNFLYITGRIKELLITAGGENVAPVPIEDVVHECLPCVGNCMLIGDGRKFLSILLTMKTEVDGKTSEPTSTLTSVAREFFRKTGSDVSDVTDLLSLPNNSPAMQAIQAGIDAANNKAVSRAQLIQKWTILPRDFSITGGELGPTLKLRRPVILNMYKDIISPLYDDDHSK